MNTMHDDEARKAGAQTPVIDSDHDEKPEKPSRAAAYVTALYIALLLGTPWLLRGAPLFTPTSNGVEMQMSKASMAPPPVELGKAAKAVAR